MVFGDSKFPVKCLLIVLFMAEYVLRWAVCMRWYSICQILMFCFSYWEKEKEGGKFLRLEKYSVLFFLLAREAIHFSFLAWCVTFLFKLKNKSLSDWDYLKLPSSNQSLKNILPNFTKPIIFLRKFNCEATVSMLGMNSTFFLLWDWRKLDCSLFSKLNSSF